MKRLGNMNALFPFFEDIFMTTAFVGKQVESFIFFLLQTDCLTFCPTSVQISSGDHGRVEFHETFGIFSPFLKSVRTFDVWSANN